MKIAVFAEDEPGAVRDGEDGFGGVAGLEVPAVDAVAVDQFDPHDEMGLQHRMRHGPDRDFGAAVARSGHRDMLFASAVGMVFDEADEAPSAARRDAVVQNLAMYACFLLPPPAMISIRILKYADVSSRN